MASSSKRATFRSATMPSGDSIPNASTAAAALPATARGSQRAPNAPAAMISTMTSPSHTSMAATDTRSRVSPYAPT